MLHEPRDPFIGPDAAPRAVVAELIAAQDAPGKVTLQILEHGGHARQLAWWPVVAAARDEFLVSRSPSWRRVAVLAGGELTTVDIASGAIVANLDDAGTQWDAAKAITWDDDEIARATELGSDPAETIRLADGWSIRVQGGVVVDGGFSGGHHGGTAFLSFSLDTPDDEVEAAYRKLWDEQAAAADEPIVFRVVLERGGVPLLGYDEAATLGEGVSELYWPPIVGPGGVLLRRGVARLEPKRGEDGEPDGRGMTHDVTMQEPWLVSATGEVTTLPFELGVGPLLAFPDGRFLLPGTDPLWRDSLSEPLSLLSTDGETAPLLMGADAVTARSVVHQLAPELLDGGDAPDNDDAEEDDDGETEEWEIRLAILDESTNTLIALLSEGDFDFRFEPRWLVASLPLDGDEPPRLLGRGQQTLGTRTAVAL